MNSFAFVLLLPLLSLFAQAQAPNPINFNTAPSVSLPDSPQDVAIEDLNQDGRLDFVIGSSGPLGGGLSIILNNGGAPFEIRQLTNVTSARRVLLADLNRDGKMDIIGVGSSSFSIVLGNGDGTFRSITNRTSLPGSTWIASGDFDGNQVTDLVLASIQTNSLMVLLNPGTNISVAPIYVDAGESPWSVSAGDIDGDGKLDLITANWQANSLSILRGNGDGTFATPSKLSMEPHLVSGNPYVVAPGDFDGDGKLDLVVFHTFGAVSVWRSQETGEFTFHHQSRLVAGLPNDLEILDFNNDGKLDLVTISDSNESAVLLGTGDAEFKPLTYGVGNKGIATGDIDGDGHRDIATVHYIENTLNILLNHGDDTFAAPSAFFVGVVSDTITVNDFDGDHILDFVSGELDTNTITLWKGSGDGTFTPKTNIVVGSGPRGLVSADFNRDGFADVAVTDIDRSLGIFLGTSNGLQKVWSTNLASAGVHLLEGRFTSDDNIDLVVVAPRVQVLVGNGDGTFNLKPGFGVTNNITTLTALAKADFDSDGFLDLAIGNLVSTVRIFLGNGKGDFSLSFEQDFRGDLLTDMEPSDLNGDQIPDLVVTVARDDAVHIMLGNGDGSFTMTPHYTVPYPTGITAGDLNGDQAVDLVIAGDKFLHVLVGNGDGTFQRAGRYVPGGGALQIRSGDLNNDNALDLLAVSSIVGVLLNQTLISIEANRTTNSIQLRWPRWTVGFSPEHSTNLFEPLGWLPIPEKPIAIEDSYAVERPVLGAPSQFFRLRKREQFP